MPLSQSAKEEIESLFVSLWYGDAQEQSDARGKLDALRQRGPAYRDYIVRHEQMNDEIGLNATTLRQRYVRVLDAAPPPTPTQPPPPVSVPAPSHQGALPVRGRIAWVSGTFLAVAIAAAWITNPVLSEQAAAAAIGQQTTLQLDDGSEVLLNTDTSLRYRNRLRSREISLERGEALFKVVHNGWRPFFVQAGNAEIKDIGTIFSVHRKSDGVDVAVLEGEVTVSAPAALQPIHLAAHQAIRMAGEHITTADPDMLVAWKDRRVDFDGASLTSVVAELSRYRTAPIVLADDRAGRARISGGFSIDDVDRLLRTLPQVAAVRVTFRADGTAVISSRQ